MKTIKLRRPTDIPPAPGAVKVTSAPAPAPAAPAPTPAPAPAPAAPAAVDTEATTVAAIAPDGPATLPTGESEKPLEKPTTVTQKKTLKLQRPGFKRPTVSGLRRPGETAAAPATTGENPPSGEVTDIPTVADIADIKPLSPVEAAGEDDAGKVVGAPLWLNVMTCLTGLAALVVLGFCTWTLFREAVGPAAGPNDLASFHSETDYRR